MNKAIYILLLALPQLAIAQKKVKHSGSAPRADTVLMKKEHWTFPAGKAEFTTHRSRPSMKIISNQANAGTVLFKNMDFNSGTIEYDVEPLSSMGFAPVYFRWQDSANMECVYLRTYRAGNNLANDAVQYSPIIRGAWLWNIYYNYQAKADFKLNQWNHVKLVVSGKQMKVYMNHDSVPSVVVPRLEADVSVGKLGFDGNVFISNLVVRPNQVEGLSPEAGLDESANDARYLRDWQVSEPEDIPKGVDYQQELYPDSSAKWERIETERNGLVNLSRRFGKTVNRRIVWLKTTIPSVGQQAKKVQFGFTDEVWVYLWSASLDGCACATVLFNNRIALITIKIPCFMLCILQMYPMTADVEALSKAGKFTPVKLIRMISLDQYTSISLISSRALILLIIILSKNSEK